MSKMDAFYDEASREYVYPDDMVDGERIDLAVDTILNCGLTEGGHHKAWVIDQVLRQLLGRAEYDREIHDMRVNDYEWDEGIAP